jgi:hypothetical protein
MLLRLCASWFVLSVLATLLAALPGADVAGRSCDGAPRPATAVPVWSSETADATASYHRATAFTHATGLTAWANPRPAAPSSVNRAHASDERARLVDPLQSPTVLRL